MPFKSALSPPLLQLSETLTALTRDPSAMGGQSGGGLFTRQSKSPDSDAVAFWIDEWSRRAAFDVMMLQLAEAA